MIATQPTTISLTMVNPNTFSQEQLTWIQSLKLHHNISSHFKAWIMATHPDVYGPCPKSDTINRNKLIQFKITHNYDKLKHEPSAPWFNFISLIPTLLQQNNADNSSQTEQTEQKLAHLQQLYDTLKQSYSKLKTHYITTNTKYTELKVKHQTTLDNNKALRDKLIQTTDTLQSTTLKYNNAKTTSNNIISTLKKQIADLHQLNDRYDGYIDEMYDVINNRDNTIQRLRDEIDKFKNGFNNITTSKLTQQAYDTLQSKYQSIEDTKYSIKCPITQEIIIEPVIAFDGQTYEKQAIQEWLKNSDKSPINGSTLHSTLLIPNHFARILIDEVLN